MRWKRILMILTLVILLLIGSGTSAREILQGDTCTLNAETTITGNLFVFCRTLIVNGTVEGSLIGAALNAEIRGTIRDDIYLAGGQLDLHGTVGEDMIFAGAVLRIHPTAVLESERSDLVSASLSTTLFEGAVIPNNATNAGYQLLLFGEVGGEVSFWGAALTVAGEVGGDVDAQVGDSAGGDSSQVQTLLIPLRFLNFDLELINPGLTVVEDAAIGGQLTYTALSPGRIEGELAEEPIYIPVIVAPDFTDINLADEGNIAWLNSYLGQVVREVITLGIVGAVGLAVMPRQMQVPLHNLRQRPLSSLGIGILSFIVSFGVWLVSALLLLLLIFVLLALQMTDLVVIGFMALGAVDLGGAGIFYFVAIYVSRAVVALGLGRLVVRLALGDDGSARVGYISLVVGAAILSLLAWLPFVGSVVTALALALGLGAVIMAVTRIQFREPPRPQPHSATVLPRRIESSRQILPPPVIEDGPSSPGMENLPEGFEWWDEDEA